MNEDPNIYCPGQCVNEPAEDLARRARLEQELIDYGQQLIKASDPKAKEVCEAIKQQFRFKQKEDKAKSEANGGLLNTLLKYVSPVNNTDPKTQAPDLEHFEDYAPTIVPIQSTKPILTMGKVDPNPLTLQPDKSRSGPMPLNEFDDTSPANFQSERTVSYNDKDPSTDVSRFFKNNPFPNFDSLSRADVTDPAAWDQIAKKKEASSPLLSLACMKADQSGFMPSNHFDKRYKDLRDQ